MEFFFKWSRSIDCHMPIYDEKIIIKKKTHILFFKTKNCSNDDRFIGCNVRIEKMLHNICISAVAISLR